jgi:hypothetical protein
MLNVVDEFTREALVIRVGCKPRTRGLVATEPLVAPLAAGA